MLTACLRRLGLWPVVAGVTVISVVVSVLIGLAVHALALGIAMPPAAWAMCVGCPLVIAPLMSTSSFRLLIKLDEAHEQLRIVSNTDHLTGAANRRHFMERLQAEVERSLRSGHSFSVALIDIDNFKTVNDRHGHLAGDMVLVRLAHACMAQVRAGDLFARFGGEEFAVLLPETGVDDALHWLERLRQQIADLRVDLPDTTLSITVSIGLAAPAVVSTHAPTHINTALRLADEALYRAKREGKNRVSLPVPVAA